MFTRKLSTTLFITLALLIAASTVVEASLDLPLQQRNHLNHVNRMIRKRSPSPQDDPLPVVIGAAPNPGASSSGVGTGSTGASASATDTSAAVSSTTSDAASASTTGTDTTSASSTGTDTTTTSGTSTSGTDTSTGTPSPTATQQAPETTPAPLETIVQTQTDKVKSTKTVVTSVQASATVLPELTGAAKVGSNVVTILIAIVASIGGILIIWTIFRKWKLGSSKKFEERMNPIDWRPETNEESGLPSRRLSSGSSYRGPSSARSADPLDHDFTAGPTHGVSPVGGYADMSRGTSPTMRERGYEFGGPVGGRY